MATTRAKKPSASRRAKQSAGKAPARKVATRTARPRRAAAARTVLADAAAPPDGDPIKHVVLLMLENRSFDHMLGCLQAELPGLDGVISPSGPRVNEDANGNAFEQAAGAGREIKPDPMHETPNVLAQLANDNRGFVRDYKDHYGADVSGDHCQQIMAFHDRDTLPAAHQLARHFTVCDQWFCPVPGPTWTNRLFALSGTSLGRVHMPKGLFDLNLHRYQQDTIFDRLRAKKRRYRIYVGDFPLALLFEHERRFAAGRHYADIGRFDRDAENAATFPEFAFIEPRYLWPGVDDDHPPHDVLKGQRLIADVYNALRRNEALWQSTLLIVTYDEHGGFYDHVVPPAAVPPDTHVQEYTFDRYGVRVPALLISPWVDPVVCKTRFDHTSVLRYLIDKWGLDRLTARSDTANSIADAIRTGRPARDDTPPSVMPRPLAAARAPRPAPPPVALNDHQSAILAFSQVLEKQTVDTAGRKVARSMRLMEGPAAQSVVARERARRFLRQRGGDV